MEGYDQVTAISREQFAQVQEGDVISGFIKFGDEFITDLGVRFENSIGIVLLIFLYPIIFLLILNLLRHSDTDAEDGLLHKKIKGMIKYVWIAIQMGFVVLIFSITVPVMINVFHKVNGFNQITVEGKIIDREIYTSGSHRARNTSYNLFISYKDAEDNQYITKRRVTAKTYHKYSNGDFIQMSYRKGNVHDTFIKTEEISELFGAIINLWTIIFGLSYYLIYRGMKRAIQRRSEKSTEIIQGHE